MEMHRVSLGALQMELCTLVSSKLPALGLGNEWCVLLQLWPKEHYPFRTIGRMVLNQNVDNFHNEVCALLGEHIGVVQS